MNITDLQTLLETAHFSNSIGIRHASNLNEGPVVLASQSEETGPFEITFVPEQETLLYGSSIDAALAIDLYLKAKNLF